jgi:hypothetical protein
MEVIEIVVQVRSVERAGLVVGDKHNCFGRTDIHAETAVTTQVHFDVKPSQDPIFCFARCFDVDASIRTDPLTLEADDALVVVRLRIDRQR